MDENMITVIERIIIETSPSIARTTVSVMAERIAESVQEWMYDRANGPGAACEGPCCR